MNQGNLGEQITDNWINQNIPGGVNSKFFSLIEWFSLKDVFVK